MMFALPFKICLYLYFTTFLMKFQFFLKKYLKNLKKPIDKTFEIHYNMVVS